MENKINMLIEASNGKKYLVINQAIYKGESYLLINAVDEKEEKLLNEIDIVKAIKINDEETLESVTDIALLELLAKYLTPKE